MSFNIVADPPLRTVTPEQRMSFSLVVGGDDNGELVGNIQWACINDASPEGLRERSWRAGDLRMGPAGWMWENAEWDFVGHHRIVAAFYYNQRIRYAEYPVHVVSLETMGNIAPEFSDNVTAPEVVYRQLRREGLFIEQCDRDYPCPDNQREAYEGRMERRQEYLDNLRELLNSTRRKMRHPVRGQYYSPHNASPGNDSEEWLDLRAFLSEYEPNCWALVDWTNPMTTRSSGCYDGIVGNRYSTPNEAINAWNHHNSYPDGVIVWEYDSDIASRPAAIYPGNRWRGAPVSHTHNTSGRFETDGGSALDQVTAVLNYIALAAGIVAGVAFLIAPVPFSRVVSAAIWTAIFSSTASATLNIAGRAEDGRSNLRDDTFDALSIAANLLAAGAVVRTARTAATWARGAVVTSRSLSITRGIVIGSFTADLIQGVLIAEGAYREIDMIYRDQTKAPDQRLSEMARVVGQLFATGALLAFNFTTTRRDAANLGSRNQHLSPELTPENRLEQLRNPDAVVDLDGVRRTESNTSQGRVRTRVQTEPPTHPPPDQATARRAGAPSTPRTNRASEHPYQYPSEVHFVRPGEPLPQLDRSRNYLWAVDPDGVVIVAPERQTGWHPNGRTVVKHRDLIPTNPDGSPGAARSGGELHYQPQNGEWRMDNESSYTFARTDGQRGTADNLEASHSLLVRPGGPETNNITWANTHGVGGSEL